MNPELCTDKSWVKKVPLGNSSTLEILKNEIEINSWSN